MRTLIGDTLADKGNDVRRPVVAEARGPGFGPDRPGLSVRTEPGLSVRLPRIIR